MLNCESSNYKDEENTPQKIIKDIMGLHSLYFE